MHVHKVYNIEITLSTHDNSQFIYNSQKSQTASYSQILIIKYIINSITQKQLMLFNMDTLRIKNFRVFFLVYFNYRIDNFDDCLIILMPERKNLWIIFDFDFYMLKYQRNMITIEVDLGRHIKIFNVSIQINCKLTM